MNVSHRLRLIQVCEQEVLSERVCGPWLTRLGDLLTGPYIVINPRCDTLLRPKNFKEFKVFKDQWLDLQLWGDLERHPDQLSGYSTTQKHT
jgi:hypothetical protein